MEMNYAKLLFPNGTPGTGGNPREVNGLPKGSEPQNCTVLVTGREKLITAPKDRRDFYIVKTENGTLVFLRICSAMAGYGYDEYVVIHSIIPHANESEYKALRERMNWLDEVKELA